MRPLIVLLALLIAVPLAAAALSAVFELPGERAIKERLGFEYDDFVVGRCVKVPGVTGITAPWRREPALPALRDEAGAAVVDGGIFIAGGVGSPTPEGTGTSVARFERFDVGTGRYERLPDLPLAVNHAAVVGHRGSVYVVGGFRDHGRTMVASDRVFRYDVRAGRWEELPRLAIARGASGATVVGDEIFVVGGRAGLAFGTEEPDIALVETYDTRSGAWSRATTMPEPRDHLGVASYGGRLFVFAGRSSAGRTTPRLDRFDPATGDWVRLADGPVETSGLVFVPAGDSLIAMGGEVPLRGRVLGGSWAYRPADDVWDETEGLPSPRHGHSAVVVGGRLYVIGGSTCPGLSPTTAVVSRKLQP